MSTMSELHRQLQETKMDDSMIAYDMHQQRLDALNNSEAIVSESAKLEILAEDAHHKARAMSEGMPYIPDDDCDHPLSL